MTFDADAGMFLADMGKPVSWTPSTGGAVITGLMLFDEASDDTEGGQVISRQYEVMFEASAWPGLKRHEVLVISGGSYSLRTDPYANGDGVFKHVKLSKV